MNQNQSRKWTAALLLLALSTLPLKAVDEPPRPPTSALGKIRDLAATVRVRRALQEDAQLSKLNLGVSVEEGVATVWGPIPSLEVGKQAKVKLEAIKGVVDVRSHFYLDPRPGDLRLDLVRPERAPERIDVAKPEIETGNLPAPLREAGGPKLFAPRVVAVAPKEANATIVKLPKPTASLADQVQETRQSEARFRAIVVVVQGTAILVKRGESPGRDVMDLVQKLRRIRGVSDVILSDD